MEEMEVAARNTQEAQLLQDRAGRRMEVVEEVATSEVLLEVIQDAM